MSKFFSSGPVAAEGDGGECRVEDMLSREGLLKGAAIEGFEGGEGGKILARGVVERGIGGSLLLWWLAIWEDSYVVAGGGVCRRDFGGIWAFLSGWLRAGARV